MVLTINEEEDEAEGDDDEELLFSLRKDHLESKPFASFC